jgi:hypothetical protein
VNTRTARLAALATAAALALSACTLTPGTNTAPAATDAPTSTLGSTAHPAPAAPQDAPPADAAALAVLPSIPAKGRAPKTGYERELFGPAWKDVDRNGCDTRNDILRRDLSPIEVKPGTRDCVVLSGHLADPYTGEGVDFQRGGTSEVDIDHLVPLSDAWQKGAQGWDQEKRERLANDPANLAASSASANRSKGDSDLATWLPPNRAHWCTYTAEIVTVKASYGLWMTPAEHDRAREILTDCTR